MKTRILSGIIMVPLLGLVYVGGNILLLACFIIGVFGVKEFYDAFRTKGVNPSYAVAIISTLGLYAIKIWDKTGDGSYYMGWVVITVIMSFLYMFNTEKRRLEDGLVTLCGIFYVVFFSYHVALVEGQGGKLVWLIFLSAFGTDIMAYFTGMAIGRRKLCPSISPKKTIEGSLGGILGSLIICGAFGYRFMPEALIHCMVIGVLGGVVSQLGDLTASVFKRKLEIKDYGKLIPGHGGVLDRFDSVLFTAPLAYYYIVFFNL